MKEKIAKLIDVKSIVTIVLTFVFAFLAIVGRINAEQMVTIFTMILSFYFGTQKVKNEVDS